MKVSANLHVEEITHPWIIDKFGRERCRKVIQRSRWYLLDGFEHIRDLVGEPCTINNYMYDSAYKKAIKSGHQGYPAIKGRKDLYINSGARIFNDPIGKALSTHYIWDTLDIKFKSAKPVAVQQAIMGDENAYPYILRMENAEVTKTWLHVEFGVRQSDIDVFNP